MCLGERRIAGCLVGTVCVFGLSLGCGDALQAGDPIGLGTGGTSLLTTSAWTGGVAGGGGVTGTGGVTSPGGTGSPGVGGSSAACADGGAAVDVQTDNDNCGACGNVCRAVAPSTAACVAGRCLVTLATGQAFPIGIAVDGVSVYWANGGRNTVAGDGAIMKAPQGGGVPMVLASGQDFPRDVAVDGSAL